MELSSGIAFDLRKGRNHGRSRIGISAAHRRDGQPVGSGRKGPSEPAGHDAVSGQAGTGSRVAALQPGKPEAGAHTGRADLPQGCPRDGADQGGDLSEHRAAPAAAGTAPGHRVGGYLPPVGGKTAAEAVSAVPAAEGGADGHNDPHGQAVSDQRAGRPLLPLCRQAQQPVGIRSPCSTTPSALPFRRV